MYIETVAYLRISNGEGALPWGRRCSGGSGQGRSGRDGGTLPWERRCSGGRGQVRYCGGGSTLTQGRMYANARAEVRCGGGGGIVRGECGGTVAVVGDGR